MDGDNRMNPTTLHGIRSNPLFATLVKRRRRYIACLTAITLIPYCGFIVLVGFAPLCWPSGFPQTVSSISAGRSASR
ncbi:DUF485 domain-containing protein [Paraburkholderia unamae]|uniref:DUF485 domain-containing protein n=1 Tax=Paraburkholderia unamae TaxID=219649 RepID=A0ACC6RLW4_9BURK